MFTDTITLYNKVSDTEWKRTTVKGVQWSEKEEKQNNNGRISVAKYVSITFPESAYENLILKAENEDWYTAINLLYCLGKPHEVVADEMGISRDALYSLVYRAKKWRHKKYEQEIKDL